MAQQRPLSRDEIAGGAVQQLVQNADPDLVPLSDDERERSLMAILAAHRPGADLWVFGYGSLLWNPGMIVSERRRACLRGFHRRLCLITRVARGTPERPGLLLGLDRGGSCEGVALRVPGERAAAELSILWRREMVDDAYRPSWVRVRAAASAGRTETLRCVAFLMERGHRRYAPPLRPVVVAHMVASAAGKFGTCRDYLDRTMAEFRRMGIRDRHLLRIAALVHQLAQGELPGDDATP